MKLLINFILLISLVGCGVVDSVKNGFKHTQEVADDIEKAVGKKPLVGFNWSNGTLSNVNITFSEVPENKSVNELIGLSRHSIIKHFEQAPDQIIIAFSIDGSI